MTGEPLTPAPSAPPPDKARRRELALTVVVCAAAAGLALYGASRTWLVETVARAAPIPDTTTLRTGGSLVPALPALALVALAAAGGLIAARGRGRAAVGILVLTCGAAVTALAVRLLIFRGVGVLWPAVCAVAGAAIVAAGLIALRRGQSWPRLGSRYERPGAAAPDRSQASMWDALDRGDDPTNT